MAFNEQAYLAANKDVADAVARGDFKSGADHYNTYGSYEGRSGTGANSGAQVNYWDNPAYTGPVFKSNEPAQSANWASGAGYATNITAPAGSVQYYGQYQDALGAYRAGTGVNPITGKTLAAEKDTWWAAPGNYMMVNPDVAMNYILNGAPKGVSAEAYALSNFDYSAVTDGGLRMGILPTGQSGIERLLGKQGGTFYNTFGGETDASSPYGQALLDPLSGEPISAAGRARYQQVFGNALSNTGPFSNSMDAYDRKAMAPQLAAAFNNITRTAPGASGVSGASGVAGGSARRPVTSTIGGASGGFTGGSSGGGSSGGSSFTSSGAPSLGFNLSNVAGPSQWDVSGNQTVANQLTALLASDNPLIQQARARAMQQSNARGLSNSSIAQTAGDAAAYDAMMQTAKQDAGTNATAAQSNTAAKNQFTTDANAFLRNGYMADFNLSANEWAAQQDFARQQQLARLQAELNASSGATQTNNNLQQGYINALNESRKNWAIQYKELMADPNMSPENKTSALTSLAASYNTQIKQYAGLLGWDFDKWDIEYTANAPVAAAPVATTTPVTP